MENKIIIVGGIASTARENRDNGRVLHGGGKMYALKAHIEKEQPKVIRKWRRK